MSVQTHEIKQAALAELNRMAKGNAGRITPQQVVDAARNPDSPLHQFFEWDDQTAAERYRLVQARTLLRAATTTVQIDHLKIAVPVFIRDPEVDSVEQGYRTVLTLRTDQDLARDALVAECKRVGSLLRRARHLAAVLGLADDLDAMVDNLGLLRQTLEEREASHLQG